MCGIIRPIPIPARSIPTCDVCAKNSGRLLISLKQCAALGTVLPKEIETRAALEMVPRPGNAYCQLVAGGLSVHSCRAAPLPRADDPKRPGTGRVSFAGNLGSQTSLAASRSEHQSPGTLPGARDRSALDRDGPRRDNDR